MGDFGCDGGLIMTVCKQVAVLSRPHHEVMSRMHRLIVCMRGAGTALN